MPDVAKLLRVTERTVYAWFSGKTTVPFAAYKLLRIMNRFELPGDAWAGWHMHSGKLWTPEGFSFDPVDGRWWSLLVRQARSFGVMYRRAAHLEKALARGAERPPAAGAEAEEVRRSPEQRARAGVQRRGPSGSPEGRREAPAPNLLIHQLTTKESTNGVVAPFVAMTSIAWKSRYEIKAGL